MIAPTKLATPATDYLTDPHTSVDTVLLVFQAFLAIPFPHAPTVIADEMLGLIKGKKGV